MADNARIAANNPNSGIVEVTPEQAQRMANAGYAVVAISKNTKGPGHVGIVAPSDNPENMHDPLIGQ